MLWIGKGCRLHRIWRYMETFFGGEGGAEKETWGRSHAGQAPYYWATSQPSMCRFKSQWEDVKSRVFVVLFVSRRGCWPLTSEIHPYICPFIYRILTTHQSHLAGKPFKYEGEEDSFLPMCLSVTLLLFIMSGLSFHVLLS